MMKFSALNIDGAFTIQTEPIGDNRGRFTRLFCERELKQIGFEKLIVQINHSFTQKKGSVRGMHFQKPPATETKIIRCIRGEVFDVIVDLRANSKTFLKWQGVTLSEDNQAMVLIPEGIAHGFQTLSDDCELLYFHTEFYTPEFESGVRYSDPVIGIEWPLEITELSERDKKHPLLSVNYNGIVL